MCTNRNEKRIAVARTAEAGSQGTTNQPAATDAAVKFKEETI